VITLLIPVDLASPILALAASRRLGDALAPLFERRPKHTAYPMVHSYPIGRPPLVRPLCGDLFPPVLR
jgi:hypothetical protein